MWNVIYCLCYQLIMHNMIIESERDAPMVDDQPYELQDHVAQLADEVPSEFVNFLAMHTEIRDEFTHIELQNDLVEQGRQRTPSLRVGFNLISIVA